MAEPPTAQTYSGAMGRAFSAWNSLCKSRKFTFVPLLLGAIVESRNKFHFWKTKSGCAPMHSPPSDSHPWQRRQAFTARVRAPHLAQRPCLSSSEGAAESAQLKLPSHIIAFNSLFSGLQRVCASDPRQTRPRPERNSKTLPARDARRGGKGDRSECLSRGSTLPSSKLRNQICKRLQFVKLGAPEGETPPPDKWHFGCQQRRAAPSSPRLHFPKRKLKRASAFVVHF